MEPRKTPFNQNNPKGKKKKTRGITLPDFKLFYIVLILRTSWYWRENRHKEQQNKISGPRNKSTGIQGNVLQRAKHRQWEKKKKKKTSLINGAKKIGKPHAKD